MSTIGLIAAIAWDTSKYFGSPLELTDRSVIRRLWIDLVRNIIRYLRKKMYCNWTRYLNWISESSGLSQQMAGIKQHHSCQVPYGEQTNNSIDVIISFTEI